MFIDARSNIGRSLMKPGSFRLEQKDNLAPAIDQGRKADMFGGNRGVGVGLQRGSEMRDIFRV
jgi:hypothetical protein